MWLAPSVFWILNQWHNNLLNIFNSLNCSYTVNFLTKFIFNAAWSLSGQFLWHSNCFPSIFTTFYLFSDLNSYIYVLNLTFNLIFMHCYGQYVSGSISDEQRKNVLRNSFPGAGACGMYTANMMSSVIKAIGMSLPYRCN